MFATRPGDPPIFRNGPFAVGPSSGSNLGGKHIQNVWAIRPAVHTINGPVGDPPIFRNGPYAVGNTVGSNLGGKHIQNVWARRVGLINGVVAHAGAMNISVRPAVGPAAQSTAARGIAASAVRGTGNPRVRGRIR